MDERAGGAHGPAGHPPQPPPQAPPPRGAGPGQGAAPGGPPGDARPETNLFAVLSLVASILGLLPVLPFLGSIIGIVFSIIAKNELAQKPWQTGRPYADWGLILGVLGLVLYVLLVLLMLVLVAVLGHMFEDLWWRWGVA